MNTTPTGPDADPPDVLLILRPGRDPLERPGQPARDADYRLKLVLKRLLRDFGFRCVRVCDTPPGAKPADVNSDELTDRTDDGGTA
jgi:hypothetical protein